MDIMIDDVVMYKTPVDGVLGYYTVEIDRDGLREHGLDAGTHNGYVIIQRSDWKADMDYEDLDEMVTVHGGLTYKGDHHLDMLAENGVKFDEPVVMFGFDTAHAWDTAAKWDKEATLLETHILAEQLCKLHNPYHNIEYSTLNTETE